MLYCDPIDKDEQSSSSSASDDGRSSSSSPSLGDRFPTKAEELDSVLPETDSTLMLPEHDELEFDSRLLIFASGDIFPLRAAAGLGREQELIPRAPLESRSLGW